MRLLLGVVGHLVGPAHAPPVPQPPLLQAPQGRLWCSTPSLRATPPGLSQLSLSCGLPRCGERTGSARDLQRRKVPECSAHPYGSGSGRRLSCSPLFLARSGKPPSLARAGIEETSFQFTCSPQGRKPSEFSTFTYLRKTSDLLEMKSKGASPRPRSRV